MKIVFLDFDGVLNSMADFAFKTTSQVFDAPYIGRLNAIVGQSGAKVVISSSWRVNHSVEELRTLLEASGFEGEIIGRTPVLGYEHAQGLCDIGEIRSAEIQAWMAGHSVPIASFVVLDDLELSPLAAFQVLTDMNEGLRDHHIEQAQAILG
jgi:hypothetical protein